MDGLESMVQDRRSHYWRPLARRAAPPLEELEHQAGDILRPRRQEGADPDADGPVASRFALIHHAVGEDAVQGEDVLVADSSLPCALLDEAQTCETVQHFAPRAIGR